MCLRVKKLLFASGFAMQALVYLSASNIERVIILLIKLANQPFEYKWWKNSRHKETKCLKNRIKWFISWKYIRWFI